jgi:hypothetical protein
MSLAAQALAMDPQYSSYVNYTIDASHIYATAVVDGSTDCVGDCPPGAMHTGKVYLALGGTGEWVDGSSVTPPTYIDISNPRTLDATPGVDYDESDDEDVYCSFLGSNIFQEVGGGGPNISIRVATYKFVSTDPETGYSTYLLSCPNGNGSCTCGTTNYLGSQAHAWAEEFTLWTSATGCLFVDLIQYKDGPPAPYNCS